MMTQLHAGKTRDTEPVTVTGTITATRGKAHDFVPDGRPGLTVSLPISELDIELTGSGMGGETARIKMPRWLAADRGLLGTDDQTGDLFG